MAINNTIIGDVNKAPQMSSGSIIGDLAVTGGSSWNNTLRINVENVGTNVVRFTEQTGLIHKDTKQLYKWIKRV